ncbi:MAG: phosphodiester glycosidase family protein [Clostridia bacterium]|nr:phosphodiester glycosidase family protein [Clostridia bacterium]
MTALLLLLSLLFVSCKGQEEGIVSEKPVFSELPYATLEPTRTPLPITTILPAPTPEEDVPVEFSERTFTINGRENRIFVLKIDTTDSRVRVVPYLSFNKIYGYETLSDMMEKTGAYAGVNSGFFFEYGRPSGLVVIDGETISPGTGRFESIVISNGDIRFETIETKVTLEIENKQIEIKSFNQPLEAGGTAVYSSRYGNTDRIAEFRKYMVIKSNTVVDYGTASSPLGIPEGGYVVVLPDEYAFPENLKDLTISISITPSFEEGTMAYEGASMLIENGISLAGDVMPWVGNLNHYDPRTCIGKFSDGSLGLVVIDGRQEGYSSGTTGRETADILLELGFTDAFMLDGGASSAMYFESGIVNSPSDMGIERILAGAILVTIE